MKTKEYIKPDMMVVKVQSQAILAGSEGNTIQQAAANDYTKENLEKLLDETDKTSIWGD